MMSVPPPGVNGTIKRTGFVGHPAALAATATGAAYEATASTSGDVLVFPARRRRSTPRRGPTFAFVNAGLASARVTGWSAKTTWDDTESLFLLVSQ